MNDDNAPISQERLSASALQLFDEAYYGPPNPKGTWFVDNEADSGILGTLDGLSAAEASRPFATGGEATAAAHADHVLFSLALANRAAAGENPYPSAKWAESWRRRIVTDAEWKSLRAELHAAADAYRRSLAANTHWRTDDDITSALAVVAHGAWHLGAIRQGLSRVELPKSS
jgi:DinB superfamily